MSKAITISVAIYQRLLALYPAEYRREYGGDMTQLFRDQCRDAWATRKGWGMAALWLRALADLVKTSSAEHFRVPFRARAVFLRMFVSVFALIIIFGIALSLFVKPSYESTVVVDPLANPQSYGFHPDPYFMTVQAQIIRSENILTNAVARLRLPEMYSAFQNEPALFPLMAPLNSSPERQDQAYLHLYRRVSVDFVPKTQLLQITVRLHDRYLAFNLANAIASSYAESRARQFRSLFPNAQAKPFVMIRDPARPARKPCLPDAADLAFPALGATLSALLAALLAIGILHLTKRIFNRRSSLI